jgi:hypothetical protein
MEFFEACASGFKAELESIGKESKRHWINLTWVGKKKLERLCASAKAAQHDRTSSDACPCGFYLLRC